MKKVITIIGIFGLIFVQAQVGINKDKPDATLDIVAEKTDGTQVEGLLVPRISKLAASTMAANPKLKESTLVYVDNTADYTTTPVALSVADITEKGYYFWNGDKWVKTVGKDGAEWLYNLTTKQVDLKRSGLTPSINKIFYDEKGRYRSLAEDETYSFNYNPQPNFTSATLSRGLNSSDNIVEATIFESINSKNNIIYTDLNGGQSKRHIARTYLVNKSDLVKNHFFANNAMMVPIENTNDYTSVYNTGNNIALNGAGTIEHSIATWGNTAVLGSQKVTGYATGMLAESSYRGSGTVGQLYGLNARIFNFAGTGTVEYSAAINSTSTAPIATSNDATLIRRNYGIRNYVGSTSNNTATGIELAGITTSAGISGKTKYPNMYGIKSTTTISAATGVVKPTNLYGLWLGDAKGAEQGNYSIYTNAGKVRFGDETGVIRNLNTFTAGENIHAYKSELTLTGASAFTEDVNGYWANVKSDGGISTNGVFVHATQTGNNTVVSPAMPLVSGTYGDARVEKTTSAYNAIGAAGMAESTQAGSNTGLNGVARNAAKINIGVNAIANATDAQIATEIGAKLASGFTAAVNAYNPSTGANDFAINAKGKVRVENLPASTTTETTNVVVADVNGVLKTKSATALEGLEWKYDATTKQIDLKRSGLTPSINKIFYDEKGRYRSLAEEETYSFNYNPPPNFTSATLSRGLNSSDNIVEATIFESINSKNNVIFTGLDGGQSKRHIARTYLVNKSDLVKNHFFANNAMIVPIENTNDYTSVYNTGNNIALNGAGTIEHSIATWGNTAVLGSQKVTGYATGMLAESSYRGSGTVGQLYGLNARIFNFAGTGIIEFSAAINSTSTAPVATSNDVTLIRRNYGIRNYVGSTSNNTATGIELAGITTTTVHNGKTKYPNMYGIKSTTTISAATGVVKPTNLYGLWLGDAKGAEQGNYAIYTNAGKVRFGDDVTIGTTAAPKKLEVNGNIKVQDTGGTALTDGTACDNPGTISYSGGSFFGCTGASVWKKLHN